VKAVLDLLVTVVLQDQAEDQADLKGRRRVGHLVLLQVWDLVVLSLL
jgi:hypothetical protein